MHVIVDAVRSTVAGIVAPGRCKEECRVRRIVGAVGAGGIRPSQERIIQHPVARMIGNSQRAVIWRNRYAVGETPGLRLFSCARRFPCGNTVILRSPHQLWKTLGSLLPGLDFIPNNFYRQEGSLRSGPFSITQTDQRPPA
jgi:hypothetical protein